MISSVSNSLWRCLEFTNWHYTTSHNLVARNITRNPSQWETSHIITVKHHTTSLWETSQNLIMRNTTHRYSNGESIRKRPQIKISFQSVSEILFIKFTTLKVLISYEEFKGNVELLTFWHWESEGLENIGELILAWMLLRA